MAPLLSLWQHPPPPDVSNIPGGTVRGGEGEEVRGDHRRLPFSVSTYYSLSRPLMGAARPIFFFSTKRETGVEERGEEEDRC